MKNRWAATILMIVFFCSWSAWVESANSLYPVGTFAQEISTTYTQADGLPTNQVLSIAISSQGDIYTGTALGLCVLRNNRWEKVDEIPAQPVLQLKRIQDTIIAVIDRSLYEITEKTGKKILDIPFKEIYDFSIVNQQFFFATDEGLYTIQNGKPILDDELESRMIDRFREFGSDRPQPTVHTIALSKTGTMAVAAQAGLFIKTPDTNWTLFSPSTSPQRSWALRDVKCVEFDSQDRLWFANPQGVGCYDNSEWTLYEGKDGLSFNDFTCMQCAADGSIWLGTTFGAIRFDGEEWAYRQGPRWLPNDRIQDMAVTPQGDAWFATSSGVGRIERRPMTLKQKADYYENEIEKYIQRTEYGYLSEVGLRHPGDRGEIVYSDSDNDGLWTSMYGAGECFAYAATQDPTAKARARKAFEALRFLSIAPMDGEVKQQPGFVARTVLPTTEPDPNQREGYTLEGMKRRQATEDGRWKVYSPRWPLTHDKKYWYKTDTSSDELDGHFFFYPLYYDLVADTLEEKERVREVVRNIADHLLRNDFCLVDHDGTPTRWAVYSPSSLNRDFAWYAERGLNSLSMLSYLAVAEHITGDPKYGEASTMLIEKHGYNLNAMVTKIQRGIGSGNQSDDEMAFMCYYNVIKYTQNETLRDQMLFSFFNAWVLEFPEMNPLFNYTYAACGNGKSFTDPWGTYDMSPWEGWLEDSAKTLTGFPLDRVNWPHANSHRLDVVFLPKHAGINPEDTNTRARGYTVNGKVLPIQNRHFGHWNTDPWRLDTGGNGHELASGTVYLLPYYMGLYYGFIE